MIPKLTNITNTLAASAQFDIAHFAGNWAHCEPITTLGLLADAQGSGFAVRKNHDQRLRL